MVTDYSNLIREAFIKEETIMDISKIIEEISPKNMRNEPKTPVFYEKIE